MPKIPETSKFNVELGKTMSLNTQYPIQVEIKTRSGDILNFTVAGQTVFTFLAGVSATDIADLTFNILEESVPKGPRAIT